MVGHRPKYDAQLLKVLPAEVINSVLLARVRRSDNAEARGDLETWGNLSNSPSSSS